jgi:hypothetical protein
MSGDKLAYTVCCSCTCVDSSLGSADVTTYKNGYEGATNDYFTDEGDICGFNHSIGGLNGSYKTFGLDHAKC